MDYTSLVADKTTTGSIKAWTGYTKIEPTTILAEAEAWIYQRLRVREMRTVSTVSIADGQVTAALPTGFLDPVALIIREPYVELDLLYEQDLLRQRTWDSGAIVESMPTAYAIFNELINLDYTPDAAYTADFAHYATPTALSGTNLTNFLTTRYPMVLRCACMAMAEQFMNEDAAVKTRLAMADALIDDIKAQDDMSRRGART